MPRKLIMTKRVRHHYRRRSIRYLRLWTWLKPALGVAMFVALIGLVLYMRQM